MRIPPTITPWNSRTSRYLWYTFVIVMLCIWYLGELIGTTTEHPTLYTFPEALDSLRTFEWKDFGQNRLHNFGEICVIFLWPLMMCLTSYLIAMPRWNRKHRAIVIVAAIIYIGWPTLLAPGLFVSSIPDFIDAFLGRAEGEYYKEIGFASAAYTLWLIAMFTWLTLNALVPALFAKDRRDLCLNCNYSLAGLATSTCPECGGKVTREQQT